MMTKTEELLAKALSTSSEEEAIACLRMARKRGGTIDAQSNQVSPDMIKQIKETILTVRSTNDALREHVKLLQTRSEVLMKENRKIRAKYNFHMMVAIAFMLTASVATFLLI